MIAIGFKAGFSMASWDSRRGCIQLDHWRDSQTAPDCGLLTVNSAFHLSAAVDGTEVEFEFIRLTLPEDPQRVTNRPHPVLTRPELLSHSGDLIS